MLGHLLFAALASVAFASECEKMRIPLCSRAPYREILLPNVYGHKTQDEVLQVVEPLTALRGSQCFDDHWPMVCSALLPPCLAGVDVPVVPCRSACERAMDDCFNVLLMLNITLAFPDCARLPAEGQDPYCMTPNRRGETVNFKTPYKKFSKAYELDEYAPFVGELGSPRGKYTAFNAVSSAGAWYPGRPSYPITHKPVYAAKSTRAETESRYRRSPQLTFASHLAAPSSSRSRTRSRSRSRTRIRYAVR